MKKPYRFSSDSVLPVTYETDVNFWLDTVDFMIQFFSLRIDLLSIFDYMDKFSLENLQTSRYGALILFEELEFDWTERFLEKCRKFSRRAALAKSAKTSIIILDGLRKLLQSKFPENLYYFLFLTSEEWLSEAEQFSTESSDLAMSSLMSDEVLSTFFDSPSEFFPFLNFSYR